MDGAGAETFDGTGVEVLDSADPGVAAAFLRPTEDAVVGLIPDFFGSRSLLLLLQKFDAQLMVHFRLSGPFGGVVSVLLLKLLDQSLGQSLASLVSIVSLGGSIYSELDLSALRRSGVRGLGISGGLRLVGSNDKRLDEDGGLLERSSLGPCFASDRFLGKGSSAK